MKPAHNSTRNNITLPGLWLLGNKYHKPGIKGFYLIIAVLETIYIRVEKTGIVEVYTKVNLKYKAYE